MFIHFWAFPPEHSQLFGTKGTQETFLTLGQCNCQNESFPTRIV